MCKIALKCTEFNRMYFEVHQVANITISKIYDIEEI